MNDEATIQDVLEAVNAASSATEERFVDLKQEIKQQGQELRQEMKQQGQELRQEMKQQGQELRLEINKQKLDILDAMDEKLGDLKGDLIVLMRKEDHKLAELVDILKQRKVITDDDVRRILGMEPFPQISI